MKVLHIQPQGEFGGMERITLDWIRHTEIEHVALVGGGGPLAGMLERLGCRVYNLRPWRPRNVWSLVPEVVAIAKRENADLLHSSNCDGHLLGGLVRLRSRRPEMWFNHGPMESVAWSRFARFLPSDALLVPSRYIERAQRRLGFWAKKLYVHAPGVDCDVFRADADARRAWREKLGLDGATCIAMLARFDPGKGQALLLEALREVRRRRPELRFKAVFVGGALGSAEAKAYERKVRELAGAWGLSSCTIFTGHAGNVTDYLNAADLHVVASTTPESFGLALLEGMAMKKATLAPREGGPGELVNHGEDGYLFPPRDAPALAAALEAALNEFARAPGRLAAMGAAARRKVERHHGILESTRRLEETYRQIVGAPRRAGRHAACEGGVRHG